MLGGIQLRESDYEVNSKWNWLNVCTSAPVHHFDYWLLYSILHFIYIIIYIKLIIGILTHSNVKSPNDALVHWCTMRGCFNIWNKSEIKGASTYFFLKFSYLCSVIEKIRILRPARTTKIICARGKCFLGKAKNGVDSETSKKIEHWTLNSLLTINQFINHLKERIKLWH